jgi:hypothetical protein
MVCATSHHIMLHAELTNKTQNHAITQLPTQPHITLHRVASTNIATTNMWQQQINQPEIATTYRNLNHQNSHNTHLCSDNQCGTSQANVHLT